jgi:hypothetical protein
MQLHVLAIVLVSTCAACSQTPVDTIQDPRYANATLASLTRSPGDYDQFHVRVRGVCQIQFEGNTLWVGKVSQSTGRLDDAVWLEVGWPVSDAVAALNGNEVVVEARFDASSKGHMGCCRGSLTDIRAIWRPGLESAAFLPRYETRADALDQLEFKTGWVLLGLVTDDDTWQELPSFQIRPEWSVTAAIPGNGLPRPGDQIRLNERCRIHLLDYATVGEQHRLESPMARGARSQSDETRFWLPAGTFVRVEDVDVHRAGSSRIVFVRVAPVPGS